MSDTPVTDAFREVVFAQYKEDELTGNGMGNILAALPDIESLERERDTERALADRLAHAWRELCETLLADKPRDITEFLNKAWDALAAWKEARHE